MTDVVLSTSADIQKILSGLDRLERKTQETARSTKKLEQDSSLAGKGLDKLGAAAAGMIAAIGVREIAQATVEVYQLAAAAERAEQSLEAVSGGQAAAYIGAVGMASEGTISRLDAMSASNRALQLGVVSSAEDMAKLTATARTLGRVMGMETTAAMNDLVTGIGRASPMILDNLGLTVKMSEVNAEAARIMEENAGMTEQQAQKLALLNQAAAQAAQVQAGMGDATRTAADNMEWFAARVEDAKVRLGNLVAEGINPAIDGYRELIELEAQVAVQAGLATNDYDEFNAAMGEATYGAQILTRYLGLKGAAARELGSVIDLMVNPALFFMRDEMNRNTFEMIQQVEAANHLHDRYEDLHVESRMFRQAQEAARESSEGLGAAMADEASEADELARAYVDGEISLAEYEDGKRELMTVSEQAAAKARDEAEALKELARAAKDAFDRQKALAGIGGELGDAQDDYRQTGDAAAYLAAQGEGLLDLWGRSTNEIELQGAAYDQLRLKYGLVTQEQLKMEHGLNAIVETMDRNILSTSMISRIYDDWITGAIPNTEALNERIADSEERYQGVLTKLDKTGLAAGTAAEESEGATDRMNQSFDSASAAVGNINWQLNHVETKLTRMSGQPWDIRLRISGSVPDIPGVVGAGGVEMRAAGGPVTAGRSYWVGDGGEPELFVPDRSGTIIPQSALASGGRQQPVVIHNTITLDGRVVGKQTLRYLADQGVDLSQMTGGVVRAA